jgi:hypothetical protein
MEISPLLIIAPAFFNTQPSVTGIPGVPPMGTGTFRSPRKFDTVSVAYVMYLTYFITVRIIHAKLNYSRILEPSMDCPASCPLALLHSLADMAKFPLPRCGIGHMDDHQNERRPNANSTLPLRKRKPSLSMFCERLIMVSLFRLSTYVR